MKAILDTRLRFKLSDLSQDQLKKLKRSFTFWIKEDEVIQLFEVGNGCLILPPNPSYVRKLGLKFDLEDNRIAPTCEKIETGITLRPHQADHEKDLEKVNFDAVSACPTSFGKTLTAVYFAARLQTYTLFIGAMTNHTGSFVKEVKDHVKDWEKHLTVLDSKWNGKITSIMVATTQFLMKNPEVVDKLKDSVGLIIADEIHKNMSGENTRERVVYKFKAKYKLFLSATYEHKKAGFAEAAMSGNVLYGQETTSHNITVAPVMVEVPRYCYGRFENWHDMLKAYYEVPDLKKEMAYLINKVVNELGRAIMLYAETQVGQNMLADACALVGVKYAIVNSKASKKEKEQAKIDFESGAIDAIIGGKSITASISLYRMSVIVATDVHIPKNDIRQLLGRSKRWDDKICDKDKILIDIVHGNLGLKRYREVRAPEYEKERQTMTGMKILKVKQCKGYDIAAAVGLKG